MHFYGYIHNDIKPANVLLADNSYLKLNDFGVSRKLNPKETLFIAGTIAIFSPHKLALYILKD